MRNPTDTRADFMAWWPVYLAFAVWAYSFGLAKGEHIEGTAKFSEVISLTQHRGWPVDLESICNSFRLFRTTRGWVAQQISFFSDDRLEAHSFNIPLGDQHSPYVLMFHVRGMTEHST